MMSPGGLAATLAALPVRITSARVQITAVALDDYSGGPRPSSVVCVAGDGHAGFGENVAFTAAEHQRFGACVQTWLGTVSGGAGVRVRVNDCLPSSVTPPYERAAIEAAVIDLAMRQAGATLAVLTGSDSAARLRFVESFAARPDPVEHLRRLRADGRGAELKLDVDAAWDPSTRRALARETGIAILDFKGHGDAALARAWAALLPNTLLEDPPASRSELGGARVARDAPLGNVRAVADALRQGEAVNLKAPRMGGPLEVLLGLEQARAVGGLGYLGGMFEVGVGRRQARQLAALFAADAPNDLAVVGPSSIEQPPVTIRLDTVGFGAGP